MATSYTPNVRLGVPAPSDRGWGDVIADGLAALDACAPIAALHAHPAEHPSTSRVVAVSPGRWRKADGSAGVFGGGSVTLPASSTRVLYLDGSGALQSAAAYPVGWHVPLATATTSATAVLSVADDRVASQAIGVGSGGQLGGLVVAPAESPSASLDVSVSAGRYLGADGAAGSYAGAASRTLPASATTVLYLDAAGALQTAAAYPSAALVRLATVTTSASAVLSVVDDRIAVVATAPPGAAAYLPLAGGTMADGATIAAGSTNGLKVGAATTQKLGFFNATPVVRPAAYSSGYATATRILGSYTPATATTTFTGLASGQAGVPYAQAADLNSLRQAYENLRALTETVAQRQNSIIADLKALGLVG